jgi:protein-tyrosine phosphatase
LFNFNGLTVFVRTLCFYLFDKVLLLFFYIDKVVFLMKKKIAVLFVCMGNICRSPTAEGVFRHLVEQAGLLDNIDIDSAGTHAYHVGSAPDLRAQETALRHHINLSAQRARRVTIDDFSVFDYIIAMDQDNRTDLLAICPRPYQDRVHLFLDFANSAEREVPDPYYGQGQGFEKVITLVSQASQGLLAEIKARL